MTSVQQATFPFSASAGVPMTDPVCGMHVDPAQAVHAEWAGATWHFCSAGCRERFLASPGSYAEAPGSRASERATEARPVTAPRDPHDGHGHARGQEWTCPMHPEVVSDRPGSCPKCGMALELREPTAEEGPNPELADMSRRLRWSAALTLPLLLLAMAEMVPALSPSALLGPAAAAILHGLLATPVVLWGGASFFRRGWDGARRGSPNMFTLVALGTGAAYAYSLLVTLAPGVLPHALRGHGASLPVFYEAAAVIVTLVLLGQVLELRARRATSGAIRALLHRAPKFARRVEQDGREVDVPLAHVQVGDRLRVRPGEQVPTDGVVLEGASAVDESLVTGESIPAEKAPGDRVTGGTLNASGTLVLRAERVGQDTILARIVRSVGEAQRSRAPLQRLADRVAAWFVPSVVLIAVLTALAWAFLGPEPRVVHAVLNAVAVLIIACPCALGLATPMSVMVGVGRAAQLGVLVRDAEAFERLSRADAVVIDKTGTLTVGRPALASVVPLAGMEEEVLRLAAALERGSEHPIAAAVVAGARARGVDVPAVAGFRAVAGRGVEGQVEGRVARFGNAAFLREAGVDVAIGADAAQALRRDGQTVSYVAADGRLVGLVAVSDPVRPGAAEAVAALQAEGLRVVMATGDDLVTAQAVARRVGIREVEAGVGPEGKAEIVRRLTAEGRRVAVAGDGVNDAPALATAHVGIAMGTGTDAAMESAGVTLVGGDVAALSRARRVSRSVGRNVRQNLFFAFVYNALGIPLAAGALYPAFGLLLDPMVAGAAMSLSSVSVIANALRLRRAG